MAIRTIGTLLILNVLLMTASLWVIPDSELEENIVLSTPDQGELVSLSWSPEHGDCVSRKNMLVIHSMYSDFGDPNYNAPRYSNTQIVGVLNILDEYFYNVSYHNICFQWHLFGMDETGDGLIDSPVPIGLRSTVNGFSGLVNNAVNSLVGFEDQSVYSTNACNDPQNGEAYDRGLLIVSSRNEMGSFNWRAEGTALNNVPWDLKQYVASCAPTFAVVTDGKYNDDCLNPKWFPACSVENTWTPQVWGTWAHETFHALGGSHSTWNYDIRYDVMGPTGVAPIEPSLYSRLAMGWYNSSELEILSIPDNDDDGIVYHEFALRPLQMFRETHRDVESPGTTLDTLDPPCDENHIQFIQNHDCVQGIKIPMSRDGMIYYLIEGRPSVGFDRWKMEAAPNVPTDSPRTTDSTEEGVMIYRVNNWVDSSELWREPVRVIDSDPSTPGQSDASFIPNNTARKSFHASEGGFQFFFNVTHMAGDYYVINISYIMNDYELITDGDPNTNPSSSADIAIPTNEECLEDSEFKLRVWWLGVIDVENFNQVPGCAIMYAAEAGAGTTKTPRPHDLWLGGEAHPDAVKWKIWNDCNLNNELDAGGDLDWNNPNYAFTPYGWLPAESDVIIFNYDRSQPAWIGDDLCEEPGMNRIFVEITNNGAEPISIYQMGYAIGWHKLVLGGLPSDWNHISDGSSNYAAQACNDLTCLVDATVLNSWYLDPGQTATIKYDWTIKEDELPSLVGIHAIIEPLADEEFTINNHWMVPNFRVTTSTASPYEEIVHSFDVMNPFDISVGVEVTVEGVPEGWEWDFDWEVMNDMEPENTYSNALRLKPPESWPVGELTQIHLNATYLISYGNDTHLVNIRDMDFIVHSQLKTEVEAQISDLEISEGEEFTISGTMDVPKSGHSGMELNGQDVLFLYESPSGEQFAERTPIRNGEVEDSFNPSVVTNDSAGSWTAYIIYLGDSNHSYSQAEIQFEVTSSDDRTAVAVTPGFSIWTFIISMLFALAVVQRNRPDLPEHVDARDHEAE